MTACCHLQADCLESGISSGHLCSTRSMSTFTSAVDYPKRLTSKMTCYVLSGMSPCTHSPSVDFRFRASEALVQEVTRLVRLNPLSVSHIPNAINYLVTAHSVEADAPEVS